ncbi:MAG: tetraprenyl-beta-curcumene synthase family protein [Solirubrobacterales bacterium]|nr:tetraprenyl-beta-curcumene synthase family protein [Solirubrobacterales bacterium]
MGAHRVALAGAFAGAARRYWLSVFPRVSAELRHWRERALEIPDPSLRELALAAQRKRGNMEGAAAFAAFAPHRHRAHAVQAAVAFQSAYNYLDMLVEQPSADPVANGRRLHQALVHALDPALPPVDYYEFNSRRHDGGYLQEMIDRHHAAIARLPSWERVAPAAARTAERIVAFQSFNTGDAQGDYAALERWARALVPASDGLRWWETAASGGSSLCAYVMFGLAATPRLDERHVTAVEQAYFPWIGALHSLLDNLVDAHEDRATGQRCLVSYYASHAETAERMRWLAERSLARARALPQGDHHAMIVAAMTGYYLSSPDARAPEVRGTSHELLATMGALAKPTMTVFASRHAASRLRHLGRRARHLGRGPAPAGAGPRPAGAGGQRGLVGRRGLAGGEPCSPPSVSRRPLAKRHNEEPTPLPVVKRSG